ncbi:MAG TPA: lipopolysaccharide biosynthesis protein RfbH [Acidisarcina sp.]
MTPKLEILAAEATIAPNRADEIRARIRDLVAEYHTEAFPAQTFYPGESQVPVSGRVFDERDLQSLVDSSLDFWLTTGRFAEQFERSFARRVGIREARLVNSGSSANLVAISVLTSPTLGDRQLRPGDEVITVAAGFPTTINPILQNQLVPVFIDVELGTYNLKVDQLEAALGPRTRAMIFAHTLGNPFDAVAVRDFAKKHNLWLVEDCCDALGSTIGGEGVGTFGDIATFSFYPAHHITMGEGGCVVTGKPALAKLIESFRDWGRDCWCAPGKDNTCGKRFDWELGTLPCGYDHKYTYSHIGYNLKVTDMQAAVGVTQLAKVEGFIAARKRNFQHLKEGLADYSQQYLLPEATAGSDPSWFGFPIAVKPESGLTRVVVTKKLNEARIATRLLFGGNLVRQPAYKDSNFRVAVELTNTDYLMNNVFWVGVYPGLDDSMIDHVIETLRRIA